MSRSTDQTYLLNDQYKTAGNLSDRAALHQKFSTNPHGWMHWVFEQFTLPDKAHILELGCGPGWLWKENRDRLPKNWRIVLSDFSPGMLEQAQANLSGNRAFQFKQVDAQNIPFDDETFDAVVANHMLYHVPDRPKAFSEIRRVLKPGGRLFAATNGEAHMREMRDLVLQVRPDAYDDWGTMEFGLEGGYDQLLPFFDYVEILRHKNALHVTEADPLMAYVASSKRLDAEQLARVRRLIETELNDKGVIYIAKDQGLFIARKNA